MYPVPWTKLLPVGRCRCLLPVRTLHVLKVMTWRGMSDLVTLGTRSIALERLESTDEIGDAVHDNDNNKY